MKHLLAVLILFPSTHAFACIDQELKDIEEIGFIADNSEGVVLNANLKPVASVEDATFGCYQK